MSTAPLLPNQPRGLPDPVCTPGAASPPADKAAVAADFASLLKADLSKNSLGESGERRPTNDGQRDRRNASSRLASKAATPELSLALGNSPPSVVAPLPPMSTAVLPSSSDDQAGPAMPRALPTRTQPVRAKDDVRVSSSSDDPAGPTLPRDLPAGTPPLPYPSPGANEVARSAPELPAVSSIPQRMTEQGSGTKADLVSLGAGHGRPDAKEEAAAPVPSYVTEVTPSRVQPGHAASRPTATAIDAAQPAARSTADDSVPTQTALAPTAMSGDLAGIPGKVLNALDRPSTADAPRLAEATNNEAPVTGSARGSRARSGGNPVEHSSAPVPQLASPSVMRSSDGNPSHPALLPTETSRGANSMTLVTKPTLDGGHALAGAGARLRDAFVSVANHAVIRSAAGGEIDVPELGRVAVRAHSLNGGVDVDISADRPEARAVLHAHAGAIATDLHEADLPLGRLTIDRADAGHHGAAASTPNSSSNSPGSFGDPKGSSNESPRDSGSPFETAADSLEIQTPPQGRVRIVL